MSDLQHKIYNYEVSPPAPLWDKIADALDESHLQDKFPGLLYQSSETPPSTSWAAISNTLDELNLSSSYAATLYNLETAPPPTAWNKIEAALNKDVQVPTQPAVKRTIPLFRYAAAAILLLLAGYGAVRILSNNADLDDNVAGTAATVPVEQRAASDTDIPGSSSSTTAIVPPVTTDEARNDAALENSKQTYAGLDADDKQKMKKVRDEFFQTPADPIVVSANFNPVHTYEDLECTDVNAPVFANNNSAIDMASRYTMLMSADGHFIRVSKKLGDLVCCVSGEEQDDDCIDQLKKWRKKIANSPVAPSPGNFMDILDLLNTLKDGSL